jgi:magnesium transporter
MLTYLDIRNGFKPLPEWKPGCWIQAECPTSEETEFLTGRFQVPLSFIHDISDSDERPRTEMDDEWQLIILRIPHLTDDRNLPFITIPLGIIACGDILLTVSFFQTPLLADFVAHKLRKNIAIRHFFEFFLRFQVSASVWYLKYLKQINHQIRIAEHELEKSIKNEELQNLLRIEKSLVFFVTSLKGNQVLLAKVKLSRLGKGFQDDDEIQELIEDAATETQQAIDMANIHSDILSGMMDAFASVISNNLNAVMKRLTSISILLMIPTLIASLFGMNIPNHLESHPLAFFSVCLGSVLLAVVVLLVFKRREWF